MSAIKCCLVCVKLDSKRKTNALFFDWLGQYFVSFNKTTQNYSGQEEIVPYKLDGRATENGAPLHLQPLQAVPFHTHAHGKACRCTH